MTSGGAALQLDLLIPAPPAPRRRREKAYAHTSRDAGRARSNALTEREREQCLQEIKGAGMIGRTRSEIQERTGIEIQSITWRIQELFDAKEIFEPVVDVGPPLRHLMRGRSKVLVAQLYYDHYITLRHGDTPRG